MDATTGAHLWADRYDRELSDVFAVQDEITQKIVRTTAGYAVEPAKPGAARDRYEGVGTVVTVELRKSRVVLEHEEIKDFMAAMVMSYQVTPPTATAAVRL